MAPMCGTRIRNHLSTLPARPEFPERLGDVSVGALKRDQLFIPRKRLAVEAKQFWLVVKRVDVTQRARAENLDHSRSTWRKMRLPRGVGSGRVNVGFCSPRLVCEHCWPKRNARQPMECVSARKLRRFGRGVGRTTSLQVQKFTGVQQHAADLFQPVLLGKFDQGRLFANLG